VRHLWKLALAVGLLAGGIFAAYRFAPGGGGPFAGTWKVVVLPAGAEATVALLRVAGDEANPTAEVLEAPNFASAEVEDVRAEGGALRFRLKTDRATYRVVARVPKDGPPGWLIGSFCDRGSCEMLRMERTDARELDPKKAIVRAPGFAELERAVQAPGPKEREADVRKVAEKYADRPAGLYALRMLLHLQAGAGASPEELKATGDRCLAAAVAYGREVELQTAELLARTLAPFASKTGGALAADYAERAEKLLDADDPPQRAVGVYQTLARALRAAGKAKEAQEAEARADELNARLDEEFAKSEVTFQPSPPAGRHGGDRVVLAELFTGTQCPPCVAADVAFDAALQVYQPSQVVFLEYHEHVPRADPLTSPASESRMGYYGTEVQGTPTVLVDGKVVESIGGPAERAEKSYSVLREALDRAMDVPAGARLNLTARRTRDVVELAAAVSELSRPGERTRLRFALAEEVVRYAAPNGQRLHHHVVRDFPGGPDGFPLPEKSAKLTAKVDLAQLRKQLGEYLTRTAARQSFPDEDRPLELRRLRAVAFVQDDVTRRVLQAAQADVPEAAEAQGAP
jgi:thiol-disulfide isomerase/thioredoxin